MDNADVEMKGDEALPSPWFPLAEKMLPFIKHFYKTEAVAEIDPLAQLRSVAECARYLRVSWPVEVKGAVCDLELAQRHLPPKNDSLIFKAADSPQFKRALGELDAQGYDVSRVHILRANLVGTRSSYPIPLGLALRLAPPAQLESYWSTLSAGFVAIVHPDGTVECSKMDKLTYPLEMEPIPNSSSFTTRMLGSTEAAAEAVLVMQAGARELQRMYTLGPLAEGHLANGCIILPPHPDTNYQGAPVPLNQQFVLVPPQHLVALRCQELEPERTYKILLRSSAMDTGGEGAGEAEDADARSLLAIPKDVVATCIKYMREDVLRDLAQREVNLHALELEVAPARAPSFGACEVSDAQWVAPAALATQVELHALLYAKDVMTSKSVFPHHHTLASRPEGSVDDTEPEESLDDTAPMRE